MSTNRDYLKIQYKRAYAFIMRKPNLGPEDKEESQTGQIKTRNIHPRAAQVFPELGDRFTVSTSQPFKKAGLWVAFLHVRGEEELKPVLHSPMRTTPVAALESLVIMIESCEDAKKRLALLKKQREMDEIEY